MNFSNLMIRGQIAKILTKEYQGTTSYSCQFLTQDEKQGFKVIAVKVEPEQLNGAKDGDIVEIPLKISVVNGITYYSATDKVKIIKQ